MADIEWTDVTDLQSNLSTVSAGAQSKILDYVNNGLAAAAFGGEDSPRWTLARCYLAAHLGELERRKGSQQATSKTIGTSSITLAFAQAQVGDALALTPWGSQYAELLAASPLRLGLTSCP